MSDVAMLNAYFICHNVQVRIIQLILIFFSSFTYSTLLQQHFQILRVNLLKFKIFKPTCSAIFVISGHSNLFYKKFKRKSDQTLEVFLII